MSSLQDVFPNEMSQDASPNLATDVSFGMTEQDVRNQKIKTFIGAIKYYFSITGPWIIRFINAFFYLIFKIIRSFFKTFLEMIKGGGGYG